MYLIGGFDDKWCDAIDLQLVSTCGNDCINDHASALRIMNDNIETLTTAISDYYWTFVLGVIVFRINSKALGGNIFRGNTICN